MDDISVPNCSTVAAGGLMVSVLLAQLKLANAKNKQNSVQNQCFVIALLTKNGHHCPSRLIVLI